MPTAVIKKGAVVHFVGRYPTLAIAQSMATVKAAEYGAGTTAWHTASDLSYAAPDTTGATQAWTK